MVEYRSGDTPWRGLFRGVALFVAAAIAGTGCAVIPLVERAETVDTTEPSVTTVPVKDEADADDTDIEELDTDTDTGDVDDASPEATEVVGDPVPARAGTNQLLDAVREMLGPTDNVSAQMNRLFPYPEIPTPEGAHVRDLGADLRSNDDGTLSVDADADFYADGSVDDLVVFYQTQLPPLGWSLISTTSDTDFKDNPTMVLEFEVEDEDAFETETLTITLVDSATLTKILVETRYRHPEAPDTVALERLNGWYDLDLLPENGELTDASISTLAQDITTSVTFRNTFIYPDRERDEIITELGDRATELSLDIEERGDDRWTVSVTPNYPGFDYYSINVDELNRDDVAEATAFGGVGILPTYLDPAALPDDLRNDPIEDGSNIYEIEAIMRQMSGRTSDVSEQINRLAPFPEVPTPEGTTIISSGFVINERYATDSTLRLAYTGLLVPGTVEDLLVFHDTQFAALGWTETARNVGEPEDGETTTTIEYSLPEGVEDGTEPAFTVELLENEDISFMQVNWEYSEQVSPDLNSMDRWLGWQTTLPFRAGREPESLQMDDNSLSGSGLRFTATYRFESPAEVVMPQVEGRLGSSDYALAPEPSDISTHLDLVHPDFEQVSMLFNNGVDNESSVIVTGQRPYLAEGVELILD